MTRCVHTDEAGLEVGGASGMTTQHAIAARRSRHPAGCRNLLPSWREPRRDFSGPISLSDAALAALFKLHCDQSILTRF